MNLFKFLSATPEKRVELRTIKHLTTDLRRPRDAKRFALMCKTCTRRPRNPIVLDFSKPALLSRQAD